MPSLKKNTEQLLREWFKQSEQGLVVLVFSASWSGSAHILYTYIEQIVREIPNMKHYFIDIEEDQDLCLHFGISQVPVCVVLKQREIVNYIQGTKSKKKLLNIFKTLS